MKTKDDFGYDDAFFDRHVAGSCASARIILGALFEMTRVRSVADVGCGVAPWLRVARDLGVSETLGLDGDYVDRSRLLVPPACFQACDLETGPLSSATRFDLAMCMEVAEHLSAARAPTFIAELCRLTDLVLFSAAIPEQGGTHHINEQWPDYWAKLFAANDYECFDVLRSRVWLRDECEWWYAQNVLVFARRGTRAAAVMRQQGHPVSIPMPLAHPRYVAQRVAAMNLLHAEAVEAGRLAVHRKELELAALREKHTETVARLEQERAALATEVRTLYASTSWRMTQPLRQIAGRLQRRALRRADPSR